MAHFSHAIHGGHSGINSTADPEGYFSAVMQRKKAEIEKDKPDMRKGSTRHAERINAKAANGDGMVPAPGPGLIE